MGLYKNSKDASNTLVPIAGRGKAEYGASTVRTGTVTTTQTSFVAGDSGYIDFTFDTPMPDTDYVVEWVSDTSELSTTTAFTKTVNGGRLYFTVVGAVDHAISLTYKAFKLYTDTEYNGLLNNQRYSTSEINTGKTWIDGYKIYRKVISLNMPNNNTSATAHGISNLRTVVSLTGMLTSGSYIMPLPLTHNDNLRVVMCLHGNDIELTSEGDYSQSSGFAVIEYTKTS